MAPICKSGLIRGKTPKQIKQRCLRSGNIMLIRMGKNHCRSCRLYKYLAVCTICDSVGYMLLPKSSENMIRADSVGQSSMSCASEPSTSAAAEYLDLNSEESNTSARFVTTPPQPLREVRMPLHIVNLCLWGEFFRKLATEFKNSHQETNNYTDELKDTIYIRRIDVFPEDNANDDISVDSDIRDIDPVCLIWNTVAHKLLPSIYRVVAFAKGIVGYRTLTTPDKLILIKRGFFAIWLTRATKVSTSTEIVFHEGSAMTFDLLEAIYNKNFVEDMFSYVAKIKALNMTDDEIAGFTACLLFYPYSNGLSDVEGISKVHKYMWKALQTVIIDRGDTGYYNRFEAFEAAIRYAWKLGARYHGLLSWCRSNWQHLDVPPLFSEIFEIPYMRVQGMESANQGMGEENQGMEEENQGMDMESENVAELVGNLSQRKG